MLEISFERSIASFKGETKDGKLKIDCWDYDKNNISPREVALCTHKKYYFICNLCDSSLSININNLTLGFAWCPKCVRKTEKFFLHWLKENYNFTILSQVRFDWCRSIESKRFLPFDFLVEEIKMIIELDGDQHFRQISNWQSPDIIQKRDKFKMQQALQNGYSIIRIYQMDVHKDKNNWKNKIKEVIKKYETPNIIYLGKEDLYKDHYLKCF